MTPRPQGASGAATRQRPAVLLPSKAQEADRRRFTHLGVAGALTKPFDPLTLPEEVAELLGWPR